VRNLAPAATARIERRCSRLSEGIGGVSTVHTVHTMCYV
jgi:hypothetical protein